MCVPKTVPKRNNLVQSRCLAVGLRVWSQQSLLYTPASRSGLSSAKNQAAEKLSCLSLLPPHTAAPLPKHLCSTAAAMSASSRCFQVLFEMLLQLPSHCSTEHLVVLIGCALGTNVRYFKIPKSARGQQVCS